MAAELDDCRRRSPLVGPPSDDETATATAPPSNSARRTLPLHQYLSWTVRGAAQSSRAPPDVDARSWSSSSNRTGAQRSRRRGRRPESNMRLQRPRPRRANRFFSVLEVAWDVCGRRGCSAASRPILASKVAAWWGRRSAPRRTAALLVVSLAWVRLLSNRIHLHQLQLAMQQRQRAETVGRILYLRDRHSSAEWQQSPVLAEDDEVPRHRDGDNKGDDDNYYDDAVHPAVSGTDYVMNHISAKKQQEADLAAQQAARGAEAPHGGDPQGPLAAAIEEPPPDPDLATSHPGEEQGGEENGGRTSSAHDAEVLSVEAVFGDLANLTLNDPYQKHLQLHQIFQRHKAAAAAAAAWAAAQDRENGAPHRNNNNNSTTEASSAGTDLERLLPRLEPILQTWLHHWNQDVLDNVAGGIQWARPEVLLHANHREAPASTFASLRMQYPEYFAVVRRNHRLKWQDEWDGLSGAEQRRGPIVDYTDESKYVYPPFEPEGAPNQPPRTTLGEILSRWKQNEDQPGTIRETLIHLDSTISSHRDTVIRCHREGVPFKLVNLPGVAAARLRWTDEYLSKQFDQGRKGGGLRRPPSSHSSASIEAVVHESINNFFVPYDPERWDIFQMGLAPTREVGDWSFAEWSRHARYADAVRLGANQPHFVWQVRTPASDPTPDASSIINGSFVTRELSKLATLQNEWFAGTANTSHCHFGERGTVTAMQAEAEEVVVVIVTGAVRIILSPPSALPRLGIDASSDSSLYRHSPLDLSHLSFLKGSDPANQDMSREERERLSAATTVDAVETVVKAGEVLYIPRYDFRRRTRAFMGLRA